VLTVPVCAGTLDVSGAYPVCSTAWTVIDISNTVIDWSVLDYQMLSDAAAAGFIVAGIPLIIIKTGRIILSTMKGKGHD
jgi:hypothetical protein